MPGSTSAIKPLARKPSPAQTPAAASQPIQAMPRMRPVAWRASRVAIAALLMQAVRQPANSMSILAYCAAI